VTPRWLRDLLARVLSRQRPASDVDYWKQRAEQFGARSVFNLNHGEAELEEVTRQQVEFLFPILRRNLRGDERLALDYGCGTGRFTARLAEAIGGRAVGVDPIEKLLELAPRSENVSYVVLGEDGRIPLDDGSVDLVWASLVLGAITDDQVLRTTAAEIARVLRSGGLLFVVENTAEKPDVRHYHFRSAYRYGALFPSIALQVEGEYYDVGERISVLAGRKA
jgi:SAM-dependent methyltransferase